MRTTYRPLPFLIVLYFVIQCAAFINAMPPLEATDEGSHFLYAHNLIEEGRLPILQDRETVFASQSVQRHHPPLYYLAGAVVIGLFDRADVSDFLRVNPYASIGIVRPENANYHLHEPDPGTDTARAILYFRWFSVVLAVGTLIATYAAGSWFFAPRIGLIAMFVMASIPSFVAVSTGISNDNTVILFGSLGVAHVAAIYHRRQIRMTDGLTAGLILAGVALSKVSGLALSGVYAVAVFGMAIRYRWRVNQLIRPTLITVAIVCTLAGWWYIRNLSLYGDPLALQATAAIWGRGDTFSLNELRGVWDSFWFAAGNLTVRGYDWFYRYTILFVIASLLTLIRARSGKGIPLLTLSIALGLSIAALLVGTQTVNISQGRLLYPALGSFCILIAVGLSMLPRPISAAILAPLLMMAVGVSSIYIRPAYIPLELVTPAQAAAQTDDFIPIDWNADGLTIHSVRVTPRRLNSGNPVHVTIRFSGAHPDNPALFVKLLAGDQVIGGTDAYPGMAATDNLPALPIGSVWQTLVRIRVDTAVLSEPTLTRVLIGWRVPGRDDSILYVRPDGSRADTLLIDGAVFIPENNQLPNLPNPTVLVDPITFAESVVYSGYSQPVITDKISIATYWRVLRSWSVPLSLSWVLLDSSGAVVSQNDRDWPLYPATAWQPETWFEVQRDLDLTAPLPAGSYLLRFGWYDPITGETLKDSSGSPQASIPITIPP